MLFVYYEFFKTVCQCLIYYRLASRSAISESSVKKYIALYKSGQDPEAMMKNSTQEQMQAGMDMWMKWSNEAGKAVVDLGNPLGQGMSVSKSGSTKSPLGVSGYSTLEAQSMDDVLALLKDHQHFVSPGMATIEVHEIMPMM